MMMTDKRIVEVSPTLAAWGEAIVCDPAKVRVADGAPLALRVRVEDDRGAQPLLGIGTPAVDTQKGPKQISTPNLPSENDSQIGDPKVGLQPKGLQVPKEPSPTATQEPQEARKPKPSKEQQAQTKRLSDLLALAGGPHNLLKQIRKHKAETSLYEFVKLAWSSIDPSPFVDSWAIQALCLHLEAVTRGDIRFFLANFPPRCSKTLVTSVCWPAWVWIQKKIGPTSGPQVRFLGASYGQDLSLKSSSKMRELIDSPWFQENWGEQIKIKQGSDRKSAFENTKGGDRQATSITGRLLGFGGDILVIDDPHNTEDVESEESRETILQGWRELSTTRLNSPKESAIVVIMQRLNEADVSGEILAGRSGRAWVHLMIPMEHDLQRHCTTYHPLTAAPLWEDPRTEDGELMWPERFGPEEIKALKEGLGPYMASGRLQQQPSPSGGGIIRREWWQLWPPQGEEELWTQELPDAFGTMKPRIIYPDFDFIFASVDTAYTEKEENDWSACTVWGTFAERKTGEPKIMLISAWRDRLPLNDLVQRIIRTTGRKNLKCDAVLIENKASGLSVIQEIKRLTRPSDFTVYPFDPRKDGGGDKVARMYAAQPTFGAKLIYAPDTTWAEMVISETEMAPKSRYMDLTDTCTQAIIWLRKRGLARMKFEHEDDVRPKPWEGNQGGVREAYGL